jgi:hypothetical protein
MIPMFIPLLLTTADPIDVNVAHIMAYSRLNKNITQVRLSDGTELYVEETPEQITSAISEYGMFDVG